MTGLTDVTVDNTISLAGVRVNLGIQNKWYVSTNGADNQQVIIQLCVLPQSNTH